jgi:hypothetical protein
MIDQVIMSFLRHVINDENIGYNGLKLVKLCIPYSLYSVWSYSIVLIIYLENFCINTLNIFNIILMY